MTLAPIPINPNAQFGLIGRDPQKLLAYEAAKKPHIGAIYNNIENVTDEQIDALSVLKWIKDALKHHRVLTVAAERDKMLEAILPQPINVDPPKGRHAIYAGETKYYRGTGSSSIEVRTGTKVFVQDGLTWMGTAQIAGVLPNLKYGDDTTMPEYMRSILPDGIMVENEGGAGSESRPWIGEQPSGLSALGVRFS